MHVRLNAAAILSVMLFLSSCGGRDEGYDQTGYAAGSDDTAIFIRASQQYYRGSLSSARSGFSGLVSMFPDSPLGDDALLAVRRIDSDLSGLVDTASVIEHPPAAGFPSLALVGTPLATDAMGRLETLLIANDCYPRMIEDPGAPSLTLVLYPEGSLSGAQLVADSVAAWLISHSTVTVQPGGNILPTVAPGHQGVVLVVGSDAVLHPPRPGAQSI